MTRSPIRGRRSLLLRFGRFPQTIGDAQGTVLFDGTYMQSNCCSKDEALLDPVNLTWTPTGSGKFDIHDEEGWTLLPNKKVLTVDAYVGQYDPTGMNFELYEPASGKWTSPGGGTGVQLWDSAADCGGRRFASFEVGPAILRPDGSVFYTGANACGAAHTAIYKGSWKAGPDFPDDLGIADGPAALEPNGKVLMMTSPLIFNTPSTFFEWDGNSLSVAPPAPNASNDSSYYGNMLILPTGQILFTDFFFVSVYNPTGTYSSAWQPSIQKAPSTVTPGGSYLISGHLFNGMSQGAAYGDDAQSATNYPIVRITNNATGHVFYSRTHDHSSMAVAFNGLSVHALRCAGEPGDGSEQARSRRERNSVRADEHQRAIRGSRKRGAGSRGGGKRQGVRSRGPETWIEEVSDRPNVPVDFFLVLPAPCFSLLASSSPFPLPAVSTSS